jgi:protoporphyrinogen oxidase
MAGLGAGVEARRCSIESLIVEEQPWTGGLCRGTEVLGCEFDRGPKVLVPGDPAVMAQLLGYLHGDHATYPLRQQTYLTRAGMVGFPVQRHLADLPGRERDLVLADMQAAWERPVPVHNYRDWLLNAYGRRLCETVLFPYEVKKWCEPLESMGHDWAHGRPAATDRADVLAGASRSPAADGVYHYPRAGGFSTLVDAITADAGPLRLAAPVTAIHPGEKYVVAGGDRIHYRRLISTLPLDRAVVMTGGVPAGLRERAARDLRWLAIKVVNLVFAGTSPPGLTAVYFPDPELIFRRVTVVDRLCPPLSRPGLSPLSVEVSVDDRAPAPGDRALLEAVLRDLAGVPAFAGTGPPLAHQIIDVPCAYPRQRRAAAVLIGQLREWYSAMGIEHCGRGGTFAYCNSDQAFAQGAAAVRKVIDPAGRRP